MIEVIFMSRLKYMKAPLTHIEFFMSLASGNVPDILVVQLNTNNFVHYMDKIRETGLNYLNSKVMDYFDTGSIAYHTLPGVQPMLTYFQCFSTDIWTLIAINGLFVSLFLTINQNNYRNLLNNIWNIFILMFSKSIQKSLNFNQKFNKLVITLWLIVVLVLSIHFCNFLLDYLIQTIPDLKIDSWDDLYHRKNITILLSPASSVLSFVKESDSPMAVNFRSRIELLETEVSDEFKNSLHDKMISGNYAYVNMKWNLIDQMNTISNKSQDFLDRFHISNGNGGYLSCFIPVNSELDKNISMAFGNM